MAVVLYGNFLSSPTYKVGLMLSLCGQAFAYRHVDLASGRQRTPEYLAICRYGQVPALVDDGQAIVQSNVILDYLAVKTGKFRGDDATYWRAKEWLAWEADRLSHNLNHTRFFERFDPGADRTIKAHYREAAENALSFLDQSLTGTDFLCGALPTVADIACWGPVSVADEGNLKLRDYPHVAAWAGRLAMLVGFEKPYDLLPRQDRA